MQALQRALSRYRTLNSLAIRVTKPGGLLMTCSCSGAMTQSHSFVSVLKVLCAETLSSRFEVYVDICLHLLFSMCGCKLKNCQCLCVQDAATSVGRRLIQLRYAGAGPDHTLDVAYPEGEYLTNVLFRVL
jgi:23S rRNA G2069 N7-methylase RlmK/C1962 C5-methylase RlmI